MLAPFVEAGGYIVQGGAYVLYYVYNIVYEIMTEPPEGTGPFKQEKVNKA